MTMKQIEPAEVLPNLVNNNEVYLFRRYANGNVSIITLSGCTIEKIKIYAAKNEGIFFMLE